MFYVHLDYDPFDTDYWSPYRVKTVNNGNNLIYGAIAVIIIFVLFRIVSKLADRLLSHNHDRAEMLKRLIVYWTLGICVYSVVKSALQSDEVSLLVNELILKVDNTLNYYKRRLRFLKHNLVLRRIIGLKSKFNRSLTNLSNNEDLVTKISEFFIFLFLLLVLFIFYVITKCSNDCRSLVVFIFKDFLFIVIISSMFLFYRRLFTTNSFKWSSFIDNFLWKDYDF